MGLWLGVLISLTDWLRAPSSGKIEIDDLSYGTIYNGDIFHTQVSPKSENCHRKPIVILRVLRFLVI